MHYNPVRHGLCHTPADWPWSSFHRLVRAGAYPHDWAARDDVVYGRDRKYHARHGAAWEVFTAKTSYIPFVAILQGRNRLVLSELSWVGMGAGAAAFVLVLVFHQRWFGASPY